MDLIGDYAGNESFIIDGTLDILLSVLRRLLIGIFEGESLIQLVLDDPLLALGRQNCQFVPLSLEESPLNMSLLLFSD